MIILAGTVIITVNNGWIIELANKVTFKQNLKNYLTDLGSYKSKKLTKNPYVWDELWEHYQLLNTLKEHSYNVWRCASF